MDHRLRWLLDLVAILGWVCWELVQHRNARLPPRPNTPVLPFPLTRTKRGLVAVLVWRIGMQDKVRRALGHRTTLRFVRTWAELQDLVLHTPPSTILADPIADPRGDPEWHIRMFSEAWGIPVVLYAEFTPEVASFLLNMVQKGIRQVIFHRFDDNPARFAEVVESERRRPPPREPPLRAA